MDLKRQLNQLQFLVGIQRLTRNLLRSAWLALATYLLLWCSNQWWNWDILSNAWLLIGVSFSVIFILSTIVSWPRKKKFTWSLDRRIGLNEQVSTAWQELDTQESNSLNQELFADVNRMIPHLRSRILRHGWNLNRDFISLLILILLFIAIFLSSGSRNLPQLAESFQVEPVDSLQEEPRVEDVFPQGLLGLRPEKKQEGSSGQNSAPGDDQGGMSSEQASLLQKTLSKLGEQLTQMAATHDLGKALEETDLDQAAAELEEITDLVEKLASQTKEQMKASLEQAASSLQDNNTEGMQEFAEDLKKAADALNQDQSPKLPLSNILSDLADDLRKLEEELGDAGASGPGAGNAARKKGSAESTERISGSGETMNLNLDDPSLSGILNPTRTENAGESLAAGIIEQIKMAGVETIQSYIIPFYYVWSWHGLVSTYFQR